MKDEGNLTPRKRLLVGRNEFPPFKRNQIRWALHCYRWKEGISWEKYPYVIASALGMKTVGEGLNSRDPRGFVLDGETPKPEKLRLYERFIETVAPDYAKAFDENGLIQTCADLAARYLAVPNNLDPWSDELIETANFLETLVYFYPFPEFDSWKPLYGTFVTVVVLRRIGDTPFFRFFSFGIQNQEIEKRTDFNFFELYDDRRRTASRLKTHQKFFDALLRLPFDDTTAISDYLSGIAVPDGTKFRYLGALRSELLEPCLVQFQTCRWPDGKSVSTGQPHRCVFDLDKENVLLLMLMILNKYYDGRSWPETHLIFLRGLIHDGIQNFIAEMGPV